MTGHRIDVRQTEHGLLVAIKGALDAETVFECRQAVEHAMLLQPDKLEFELTDAEFLDSSGVGFLVELMARTRRTGKKFKLSGAVGQPARLIDTLGGVDAFQT